MSSVRHHFSSQSPVSMRQIYRTVPMFSRHNAGIAYHAAFSFPCCFPFRSTPPCLDDLSPLDHGNTTPLESVDPPQQLTVVCVLLGRESGLDGESANAGLG